jgi:hypothetical protein
MRDGTGPQLTYQLLMRRANDKMDAIEKDRAISQSGGRVSARDQINALQAKLEALEKKQTGNNSKSNKSNKSKKKGSGGGKDSKKSSKKKKGKKEWKPFPSELKGKPEPSDHSKPVTIDGINYYYCFTHKWCKHSTAKCKIPNGQHKEKHPYDKEASSDKTSTSNSSSSDGTRQGRAISALNAVIQGTRD